MRSAVYRAARRVAVEEREPGHPGGGEVQIAVSYTGICGTDLHIFHGDMDARVSPPAVLGHEMSGRVSALGAGVSGWTTGQPVTVMPTRSCGRCDACRRDLSHVCWNLNFMGIDSPGSMQTSWVVPESVLVGLPEGLPLADAAVVEPLAVAVHDVRRARVADGDHVVVVGGGPVRVLIAAVAQEAGGRVLLAEPNPKRRAVAGEMGLEAVDPDETDVATVVNDRTDGAGAVVAFEVSGAAAGVATAVEALAARGRLVQVAIHPTPREIDLHRFFWRELELIGARLYQRSDFEQAVQLIASGDIGVQPLISGVEPLDPGSGGVRRAQQRTGNEGAAGLPSGRARMSTASPFDLTGKVAVITGARRGIGLAMAGALADAGADIVAVSAHLEDAGSEVEHRVRAAGRDFTGIQADLPTKARCSVVS